jgi:hypothetical protein
MTTQKIIIIGAILIVSFFLIRVLTWKKKSPRTTDLNATMMGLADDAVKLAEERGIELDYSPGSVEQVEQMLAPFHELRSRAQLSDEELDRNAHRFGAYIGEVLRRMHGGHWTQDHDVVGPNSYPFHWKCGQTFPIAWCGKRIINGDEDNVWFKFQVVTSEEYLRQYNTENKSGEVNGKK